MEGRSQTAPRLGGPGTNSGRLDEIWKKPEKPSLYFCRESPCENMIVKTQPPGPKSLQRSFFGREKSKPLPCTWMRGSGSEPEGGKATSEAKWCDLESGLGAKRPPGITFSMKFLKFNKKPSSAKLLFSVFEAPDVDHFGCPSSGP